MVDILSMAVGNTNNQPITKKSLAEHPKTMQNFRYKETRKQAMERLSNPNENKPRVSVSSTVGEGKPNAHCIGARAQGKRSVTASMDLTQYFARGAYTETYESYDPFDARAKQIIDMLQNGDVEYEILSWYERCILHRYLFRYNPIIGRIVDLHVNIIMSKLKINPPTDVPEPIKDYIMNFYKQVMDRVNFSELIREFIIDYYVYGDGKILVEDQYNGKSVLQDITKLPSSLTERAQEEKDQMDIVEKVYANNPEDVDVSARNKYLKMYFKGYFDPDYRGPEKMRNIKFYDITERYENPDIDFEAVKLIVNKQLIQSLYDATVDIKKLQELGYSLPYLNAVLKDMSNPVVSDEIVVDNDVYSGEMFMMSYHSPEYMTIMQRVIDAALEWENIKDSIKIRTTLLGKVGRIVTAEGLSEDQLENLRSEVETMLSDPTYAIVANYSINWQEVERTLKDDIENLETRRESCENEIMLGLGTPPSLISGESTYSGDNIKLEIMNTEFLSLKQKFQTAVEEKFSKPLAIRKGFITTNDWGETILVYPRLSFSRISIRDRDVAETLFNMYLKNSISAETIYDLYNIDSDQQVREIKKEMFTLKDPNTNELIRTLYEDSSNQISQITNVKDKIIRSLGLNVDKEKEQKVDTLTFDDPDIFKETLK